jgi:hypothetical protein
MPEREERPDQPPASVLDAGRGPTTPAARAAEHPEAPAGGPYDVPAPGDRVGGSLPGGGGGTAPGVQAGRSGRAGTVTSHPVGLAREQGEVGQADSETNDEPAPPPATRPANAVPGRPEGEVDPRG